MAITESLNAKKFFGELKRRNVYKVAVAYAVISWLVMQGYRHGGPGIASAGCNYNALTMDLQMRSAEPQFQKAIALNPNYATAHQWYGEYLLAQGRADEALAELKRAHDLDPLSLIINSVLGSALGIAGQPEEAIAQLQRTLEMDPTFGPAQFMLGQLFEDRGDLKRATVAYEKARDLNPSKNPIGHAGPGLRTHRENG